MILSSSSEVNEAQETGGAEGLYVRIPLTNAEAAELVFDDGQAGDFYPLFVEAPEIGDGVKLRSLHPAPISQFERHDEWIGLAGERKTFWNLCSYRPSAIRRRSFTWKKSFARGVHGVFIDFDCGRQPGDRKSDEPGALLSQNEVWRGVNVLVEEEVLPPFQMWADGTRGCYGVLLFDRPENVFEAAESWKEVREFFYRRAKHLAADELARSITQALKAPGACGDVRYYSTGHPRTSMAALTEWFREHPHVTDVVRVAPDAAPVTVAQQKRLEACRAPVRATGSLIKRRMGWRQKVAWAKARMDDMYTYVKEFRRTGESRRQFFLDLASAVKHFEFACDQNSQRAYAVALEFCHEVNSLLDQPLPAHKLREQVHSADPKKHRSSELIRLGMGITETMAERLNLRALVPRSVKVERNLQKHEQRAARAEARAVDRQRKKEEKEVTRARRRDERERARVARPKHRTESTKPRKSKDRDEQVAEMLRQGCATGEITEATGAHRQQVARVRARLLSEGSTLPPQRVLKHGRSSGQVTRVSGPRSSFPLASGQNVTGTESLGVM